MTNKTVASGNVDASVRQRISETLKKKWEDPEFRSKMMDKFSKRKVSTGSRGESHRQKISEAMKKKWMDEEYRKRATEGMAKGRERDFGKPRLKPVQPKMPTKRVVASSSAGSVQSLQPLSPVKAIAKTKTSTTKAKKKTKTKKKKTATKKKSSSATVVKAVQPISSTPKSSTPNKEKTPKVEEKTPKVEEIPPDDGCITRLREERRDLYDLLYGDEEEDDDDDLGPADEDDTHMKNNGKPVNGEASDMLSSSMMAGVGSNSLAALLGDDDDLDDFDPYGLQ
jgi:hypothetical protein